MTSLHDEDAFVARRLAEAPQPDAAADGLRRQRLAGTWLEKGTAHLPGGRSANRQGGNGAGTGRSKAGCKSRDIGCVHGEVGGMLTTGLRPSNECPPAS